MLEIACMFVEEFPIEPIGFEIGNMEFRGDLGVARSKSPDQSVMVVLAIVGLLDGIRRLLSYPHEKEFTFVATDSSFQIVFRKTKNVAIGIYSDSRLIHSCTPQQLRLDIQRFASDLSRNQDVERRMNAAEASDLRDAIADFQEFNC